jgi:hypothetical protein
MANPLPRGTIPKLFRIKRGGKEVGSWNVTLKGKRINLRTQDYLLARERASQAVLSGVTDFQDDTREPLEGGGYSVGLPPVSRDSFGAIPSGSDDWATALNDAADSVAQSGPALLPDTRPEIPSTAAIPDGYEPPPPETPEEKPSESGSTAIPPELFDNVLGQVAMGLVQGQLMLHDWLAKRWAGVELGEVPFTGESAAARKVGVAMWKEALKDLFPTDIPLPAYLAAPLMVFMMGMPVQIKGAKAYDPNADKPSE